MVTTIGSWQGNEQWEYVTSSNENYPGDSPLNSRTSVAYEKAVVVAVH